ncbi:E3 ubiquitin-protein ligase MARCHF1-like isoform X1 [Helicoverpa zea]|uniref:RING-CH-type domain-containing protein n=1 Tax=Helicoverpa armigera TaxID=29058 RepID=A0A2W1BJQ4_HELAM|nr:E3 ubiquitin-protein ligase MARCHF1-like isoform X1 [Helicoverpa zea]XP_049705899.1 E3 ubiquitin-protein ligase MARCHF1 isoform X1 [Helicoverpa armigera]PZC75279.1 hypothetical protein B5X24_HaOG206481 [Helicoverpa armigera]
MDKDEKNKITDGDKTTTNEVKPNDDRNQRSNTNEDAGPSGAVNLPGAVHHAKNIPPKPGISKSEHSMRHIITSKDVTNALKSLSFGAPGQVVKNLNLKELNIPILDKDETSERDESTTLIDLKKFMASCFKFNKEAPSAIVLSEIPNVQNVHPVITPVTAVIPPPDPPEIANPSYTTVQTECVSINTNEVIITNAIEPKISKSDKKKTSGSLSEKSDLGITARDSLSSIGSNVCRICMTRGRERLISPCNCKGSLANVHLSCLERWLNQVGRNHCELCGFSYPAIRTPRYTVLQALRLWFGNPRNRSHLQSDCLIFWLLSTVTAGLLAVCIVGTQYFVIEGTNFGKLDASARKEEVTIFPGISHRITETAMDFFMAIVLCGYSVTVYLLWKDHYVMWNRWRRANVNVRLLLTPDSHPVPFVPRARYNVV